MKQNRESESKNKQEMEVKKYEKNRSLLKKMHEKLRIEKYTEGGIDIQASYMGIKNKLMGGKGTDAMHAKVNLEVLKHMHYTDFNMGEEDDFKPGDIIDEDDDSDDSILEQYGDKPQDPIVLPKENVIMNKSEKDVYDEKVTHIKHQIKDEDKDVTSKDNNQAIIKIREINKSNKKSTDNTMLGKYREGRNTSMVNQKSQLKNSYSAYPQSDTKMRQNNSVSKISQSIDMNKNKNKALALISSKANQNLSKRENITLLIKNKGIVNCQ